MIIPIQELYENHAYPAMSHPLSDPAVSAVAAAMSGLQVPHPAAARVLEIGCCSGFNLIPLALRWPNSEFVGIDLAGPSIVAARELAAAAGVSNIEFHAVDLRDFTCDAGERFDFIIAHGFLSWVPDEVKAALFPFCRENLTPSGIATISFNLASGWFPRFPVIEKVRAIQQAGSVDVMIALDILRSVTPLDSPELPIIDDMMAKGLEILAFDDFGPINDPWSLDQFVQTASAAGLRWLGESHPAHNRPPNLIGSSLAAISSRDPLACHLAADVSSARTFRSSIICRKEAHVVEGGCMNQLFELFVRAGAGPAPASERHLLETIASMGPSCVSVAEVAAGVPSDERADLRRRIWGGIEAGWILPRIEPVMFEGVAPERPTLNAFRLECARRGLPLVDIWHQPCTFPGRHQAVLAAMDGTLDQAGVSGFAKRHCPELAFEPWLDHLAGRGMFT